MRRNQLRERDFIVDRVLYKIEYVKDPPPHAQSRQVSSDAHRHDAKKILELFGRKKGVALALNVVDAGPVGGKPDFSNNSRAVGGEDESVGSISEEAPKDF